MIFEFVLPFFDDADGRHGSGVAERAKRAAEQILCEFAEQRDIFGAPFAAVETVEHTAHPGGAFAAGNAPAAGFVGVEMHDPPGHVDHAGVFVHDHYAAGTEHGADFGDGIIIHGHVGFRGGEHRARAASGNDRLQFFAVADTAANILDQTLHRKAHRQLVNPGLIDVPGNREHAGSSVFRSAQPGIPFAALEDNGRPRTERFDVVDHRGAAVQTGDGRERRPNAGIAALAFERFHQGRFFAALVGSRASVGDHIEIETAAQNIFPHVSARVSFGQRRIDDIQDVAIFAANVDVAFRCVYRAPGDHYAFDQLVRVELHERTVFAGAGLAFVGVAENIFRFAAGFLGDETPFHSGGEAGAAAARQLG